MKRVGVAIAITLFVIFAMADMLHEFVANDGFHFFSNQPRQLLLVALIAIVGGLFVFLFYWLSPRLRRRVKLLALGSAASLVTFAVGWFLYRAADFGFSLSNEVALSLLFIGIVAFLLWFEFYQIFRIHED